MDDLDWREDLDLGIAAIDREHRELLAILVELAAAGGRSEAEVYGILFRLTTHAEAHFKNEQLEMQAEGFPGIEHHERVHATLLKEVGLLTLQYGDRPRDLSSRLLGFLRAWLLEHITTEDKAFGEWVRACRQAREGC